MNKGMKQVYKCICGKWARKEYKFLTVGKPICPCGRVMRIGYRYIAKMAKGEPFREFNPKRR